MQSATVVLSSIHLCRLDTFRTRNMSLGHKGWSSGIINLYLKIYRNFKVKVTEQL